MYQNLGQKLITSNVIHRVVRSVPNNFIIMYQNVEPSDVQALKNPNPLKDDEAFAVLGVAVLV